MKTQIRSRNITCAIAGEAYNTQTRTAGRRGDGNDGVSDLQVGTFKTNTGKNACATLCFSTRAGGRLAGAADLAFYPEALRGRAEEHLAAAGGAAPAAASVTATPHTPGKVPRPRPR